MKQGRKTPWKGKKRDPEESGKKGDIPQAWRDEFFKEDQRFPGGKRRSQPHGFISGGNMQAVKQVAVDPPVLAEPDHRRQPDRSEEHTSELQSRLHLASPL